MVTTSTLTTIACGVYPGFWSLLIWIIAPIFVAVAGLLGCAVLGFTLFAALNL